MKKRLLALLMIGILLLSGCGKTEATGEIFTIEKDGETVSEVSMSYAWLYTLMYKDTYELFFGETFWDEVDESGATYEEIFKESMMDELKQLKVISLEADKVGVSLTAEEVEMCKADAAELIHTIEEDTLKMTGIDEDVYSEYEADCLIYDKYKTEILADKEVNVNREDVRMSDLFVLRFPTIDYDEEGEEILFDDAKKLEQKKKADQAYAMLEAGKPIDEVAESFDIDPEECMSVEGPTPEEERDEYYNEPYEKAAFSLKEGEYSKVTECDDGYYIIKMVALENEEETTIAWEDAKQEALENLFVPILEEIVESYDVTMNEENWEKISFKADIAFEPGAYGDGSEEEEEEIEEGIEE